MELLRELAMDNRLVITSIHQPREEIFQMFTHVMLFYEGRMLFFGSQQQLQAFFTLHGLVVPKGMSSADFMGTCNARTHNAARPTQETDPSALLRVTTVDLACRGEFPEWDESDLPQVTEEGEEESSLDSLESSKASGFVEADVSAAAKKKQAGKGKNGKYAQLQEDQGLPELGLEDDSFLNDDFNQDDDGQQGAPISMQFLVLMYRSMLINVRDGANSWMLLIIGTPSQRYACLLC